MASRVSGTQPLVEGMYIDGKQCCVFVIPTRWSCEGEAVSWNMHGAWHEKSPNYGSDWISKATRDNKEKDKLILEHTTSKKDFGSLTTHGIKWKKESWTRVHSVGPQFAYFRRPPYPMLSLFLFFSLSKALDAIWSFVKRLWGRKS